MKISKKTNRIASKVVSNYLENISELIDPSAELYSEVVSDPKEIIMQKDKVTRLYQDREGDVSKFEKAPEFQELNFLVKYLIQNGKKIKKDSF